MTKKQVPLECSTISWQIPNFPDCDLTSLCKKYGFNLDYDLHKAINVAWDNYMAIKKLLPTQPAAKQIKDSLRKIKAESKIFLSQIKPYLCNSQSVQKRRISIEKIIVRFLNILLTIEHKLPYVLARYSCFGTYAGGWRNRYEALRANLVSLQAFTYLPVPELNVKLALKRILLFAKELHICSVRALASLKPDKCGPRAVIAINYLIGELAKIYYEGTGKKPTAWSSSYADSGYDGAFISYATEVLQIFGIPEVPEIVIGRRAKTILDDARKVDSTRAMLSLH